MIEEWRVIPGYEEYAVSNKGRVRSALTRSGVSAGKILRPIQQPDGHLYFCPYRKRKKRFLFVHTAVLLAFVGPKPSPKHETAHWDNDPTNNTIENLRWATRAENAADMARHGILKGSKHPGAKITEKDVRLIRQLRATGVTYKTIADEHLYREERLLRRNMESRMKPTHLYHGTNGRWLNNILRTGIEPRGNRAARDNWKHVPHRSNRRCVYLTDSYAPYFAHNACDPEREGEVAAVIEIAVDRLDPDALYPDEDFLEQASRGCDGDNRSMSARTLSYRARQFTFRETGSPRYALWWHASIAGLGTCSYRGTIPVSAITRVVTYPYKANQHMRFVYDPTISLMNQLVCGEMYRTLTAKLFAGEFTRPGDLPSLPADTPVDDPAILALWEAHRTALPPIKEWKCDALRFENAGRSDDQPAQGRDQRGSR